MVFLLRILNSHPASLWEWRPYPLLLPGHAAVGAEPSLPWLPCLGMKQMS